MCDLRGANFRGADLSNVFFKKVQLNGADFYGAINIPKDLKLDNEGKCIEEDEYTTPSVEIKTQQIFFSTPSVMDPKETYYKETLKTDIEKYNKQYSPIEYIQFSKAVHDRFLIIDNDVYHMGASVKDMGKSLCAVTKMNITPQEIIDNVTK